MSERIELNECDKEPIHLSQYVQSHGFLMAVNKENDTVDVVSENSFKFTGRPSQEVLGQYITDLLSLKSLRSYRQCCRNGFFGLAYVTKFEFLDFESNYTEFNASVSENDTHFLIDLEPVVENEDIGSFPHILEDIQSLSSSEDLKKYVVREIKRIFRYDRVMYYHFLDNGDGQVEQEEVEPDIQSFIGHRFPASDIPKQARALYVENKIRLISDSSASPIPLVGVEEIDLSNFDIGGAHLRSVSPIHIEYMKNMGIGSSLSISIVKDDKLVGMVISHAISPRYVSLKARSHALAVCNAMSLMLSSLRAKSIKRKYEKIAKSRLGATRHEWVEGSFDYDEKLLVMESESSIPSDLDEAQVQTLKNLLKEVKGTTFESHTLREKLEDDDFPYSGMMGHYKSESRWICFLRRQTQKSITWGGRPYDKKMIIPKGGRIEPRKSFESWEELQKNESDVFTKSDRDIFEIICSYFFI